MKLRFVPSIFSIFLALFFIAGAQKAEAADFRFSVGGGHDGYRYHDYRTSDSAYGTWYTTDSTPYVYSGNGYSSGYSGYNGYSGTTYVTPYVYSTPSTGFSTWYGDGYRYGGNSYGSGRGGYYGGGYNSGRGRR